MATCKFCGRKYEPEEVAKRWPSVQEDKFCGADCEEFYYFDHPEENS
jgi:hypothetical protein